MKKTTVVIVTEVIILCILIICFIFGKVPAKKWLANGAQPTETVGKLLKQAGIEK